MTPSRMVAVTVWSWLWISVAERSARRRPRRSRQSRLKRRTDRASSAPPAKRKAPGSGIRGTTSPKIHLSRAPGEESGPRAEGPRTVLAADTGGPYTSSMAFLDTKRDRGAFLIFVLGLGLVYALWPFSTGLIGAPVLYIMFVPL